jgi:hypothetical protein
MVSSAEDANAIAKAGPRSTLRIRTSRLLLLAALALIGTAMSAAGAQAAAPAFKLIGALAPTHLPPKQSAVQHVVVEAEGGAFRFTERVEGEGLPVVVNGSLTFTAGSDEAVIDNVQAGAEFAIGDRVAFAGEYEFGVERLVVGCSSDCKTPGSTVTLSEVASAEAADADVEIFTKELTMSDGQFHVGEEITGRKVLGGGTFEEYFAPGTVVTAIGAGVLTLSNPTTFEYVSSEEELELLGPRTESGPVLVGAAAPEVQQALEMLAALGPDSVTVEGSGRAEDPYVVKFGGTLADQVVPPLTIDASELTSEPGGPGVHTRVTTPVSGGPGTGEIVVDPTNVGGRATTGPISLTIGPLPQGAHFHSEGTGQGWVCPEIEEVKKEAEEITCRTSETFQPMSTLRSVTVEVEVESEGSFTSSVPVGIAETAGGSAGYAIPFVVSSKPAEAGIAAFWAGAFDEDGRLYTQAGGHPFSAQTFFLRNTVRASTGRILPAGGESHDVRVDLPPGFLGDPLATARCPQEQVIDIDESSLVCTEAQSLIGRILPVLESIDQTSPLNLRPIFNDVPAKGYAAEFTGQISVTAQSLLGSVRSDEDFGVSIVAPHNSTYDRVLGANVVLEGEPSSAHGKAFLDNPTDCAEEARKTPIATLTGDTWQQPGIFSGVEPGVPTAQDLPPVTGCDQLQFKPTFEFQPDAVTGSSPTGATARLRIPQQGLTNPSELRSPDLKRAEVTLPQGLNLNPSSANGLQSCTESQMGYIGKGELPNPMNFDESPVTCPDASKLGTVEIKTPLLEEPVEGTIYLGAQEENPFHSLIALYLVVESERFGLTLKLPGEVKPDPITGQLTATFDYNPQLPFEELELHFRGGGPRSELATPEVCGTYKTTGSLTPWSAPESGPPAQIDEGGFTVSSGCSSSDSTRPFGPTFEAGTTGTQAGSYSPLAIKVNRKDGEQELRNLDFTLPMGLTGKLAGIPYCPEAQIREAEGKSGKAEQSSASCPAASQIGTVDTAAGVGSEPIHVGGNVYLAGPYRGAPLSSVVVTPAVAGPFDLGDVVIRAPLFVDPETAEITAKSDPIPAILKGIPLKVRSVSIYLDRSDFTLNPTSCNVMLATASIGGSSGATANPSSRFQVGGCNALKFKPRLQLSLKGSTRHAGHPALKAVVTYPKQGAYANIRRAQVNLPHSEFLDQGNLNKTCTRPVLLAGNCPKSTIYGKAKAWTPLLDKPLEGNVYLVGGFGYKLPALVAELNGQIRVVLKGKVDSGQNKGIRNTFEAVPDAPVERFVLEMKGGKKYSLLENSENLCAKPQKAIARFTAQNGAVLQTKPVIANDCGKGKKKKKGHKKSNGGKK